MDCSAIVNDRLSAFELARTPNMGHDGRANDVTLSNNHAIMSVLCLHRVFIYIKTQKYRNTIRMHLSPTSKLGYLSLSSWFNIRLTHLWCTHKLPYEH